MGHSLLPPSGLYPSVYHRAWPSCKAGPGIHQEEREADCPFNRQRWRPSCLEQGIVSRGVCSEVIDQVINDRAAGGCLEVKVQVTLRFRLHRSLEHDLGCLNMTWVAVSSALLSARVSSQPSSFFTSQQHSARPSSIQPGWSHFPVLASRSPFH